MSKHISKKFDFVIFIKKYRAILIFIIIFAISSILSPNFLSKNNLMNILKQQCPYLLISVGILFVMMSGNIDLSVCSITAIASVTVSYCLYVLKWTGYGGLALAVLVAIGLCLVCGAINGLCSAILDMPAFLVTLASTFVFKGIAYIVSKGTVYNIDLGRPETDLLIAFARGRDPLIGVSWIIWFELIVVIIAYLVIKYTVFGRMVIASGSNKSAAKLAGINVKFYQFVVFLVCSFMCALAGIYLVGRAGSGSAEVCNYDYNMICIAGVVLGGTSLSGGKGSAVMTVVGVLIVAIIKNIMNLIGVPAYPQWIVEGAVIIFAIFISRIVDNLQVHYEETPVIEANKT